MRKRSLFIFLLLPAICLGLAGCLDDIPVSDVPEIITTVDLSPTNIIEATLPTDAPTLLPTEITTAPNAESTEKEDTDYSGESMVWIPTKGGKKYHIRSGCSNMIDPEQVTRSEAEEQGFTPCKKCYK